MLCLLPPDFPIGLWSLIAASVSGVLALVAAIAAISAAKHARAAVSTAAATKEDLARVEQNITSVTGHLEKVHGRLDSLSQDVKQVEGRTGKTAGHLEDFRSHLAAMQEDLKRVENSIAATAGHLENVHTDFAAMNRRLDTQQIRDAVRARVNGIPLRFMGEVEPGRDGQFTITTKDEGVVLNRVDLYSESGNKFGSSECEPWNPPTQMLVRLNALAFMKWYEAGSLVGNLNLDRSLYLRVYMRVTGIEEEVSRSMTVTAKTMMPQPAGQGMTTLKYRLHGEV